MSSFAKRLKKGIATAKVHPAYRQGNVETQTHEFGNAEEFSCTASIYRRILALTVNIVILVELTFAMYVAAKTPELLTPKFFITFFPLLIPTLIIAFFLRRYLNKKGKG